MTIYFGGYTVIYLIFFPGRVAPAFYFDLADVEKSVRWWSNLNPHISQRPRVFRLDGIEVDA